MILTDLPEQSLERFGEYTMLYAGEREVTNQELQDSANRLANGLHNLGVKPGDRVVVCMPNSPEVFIAYQAILRAGAIVLPVMLYHQLQLIVCAVVAARLGRQTNGAH